MNDNSEKYATLTKYVLMGVRRNFAEPRMNHVLNIEWLIVEYCGTLVNQVHWQLWHKCATVCVVGFKLDRVLYGDSSFYIFNLTMENIAVQLKGSYWTN